MRSPGPPGPRRSAPRACRTPGAPPRAVLAALLLALLPGVAEADEPPAVPRLAERLGETWRWRALRDPPGEGVLRRLRSDGDGRALFASDGDDLHLYDGWRWRTIPDHSTGYWNVRHALTVGDDWLITTDSTVSLWGHALGEVLLVGPDEVDRFTTPVRDPAGRILVGLDELLYEVREHSLTPLRPAPAEGGELWELVRGPRGDVLALMQHGLFRLADGSWERLDTAGAWPDGFRPSYVLATAEHVFMLPRPFSHEQPGLVWDGRRLAELPRPPVEGVEIIEDATVHPDGTLLLATRHARLLMLHQGRWTQAPPAPPLDREYISSACFVGERLVVLTGSGLAYACDTASDRWRVHSLPGGIANRTIVNALHRADDEGLWATTEEGVGLWSGEGWSEFHRVAETAAPGNPEVTEVHSLARITTICVDDRGHVWVASGSAFTGALEYDGATWTRHDDDAGFDGHPVHRIVKGPDGALWFALLARSPSDPLSGGGLVRLADGEWTRFTVDDGLPHDRCYDIAFTPDGAGWVATRMGLGRFDGERWAAIEEPGLHVKLFFSLFVDSRGELYAGRGLQFSGVWRRDAAGVWHELVTRGRTRACAAQFAEDTGGRVHFASDSGLFRVDGRVAVELTAPWAAPVANYWPVVSDGAGGLWLGSRGDGLVHYTPDDHTPPVIAAFDPWSHASDTSVHTGWSGSDYWNQTPPGDLVAEIRVNGDGWSPEPASRSLSLDPGAHTLELRLTDRDGNVSRVAGGTVEVPDRFAVRSALRVSGVFLLMALAVVGGSGWLRARERRAERTRLKELTLRLITSQEDERRRLSRDLHDDLGQLLTAATLELQLAGRAPDEAGREAALQRALGTVRLALERARKFSAGLRPRMLDELGLPQALSAALSEFHERTGVTVVEDIDLGPERLPEPLAGHVYRMVQEALTNVARHARASRVEVRAQVRNGRFELEFVDDGVGFAAQEQQPTGGQGLDILAERAAQVGGRLEVDSSPGKGTRIRLFAPASFAR